MKFETLIIYNPSFEKGGVERNIVNILKNHQFTKNFKIKIISVDRFKINKKNFDFLIPKIFSKFLKKRIFKYFISAFYLLFYSFGKKTLIFSFQNNSFAILISMIAGCKIVIRLNTAPEKYIKNFYKKKFFTYIYGKANLVLCNSVEFKKHIKKFFNINSHILKNFINIKEINLLKNKKYNNFFLKENNSIKLINVGRLVDQKNQLILLKAAKLLRFNFKILIIGNGIAKNKLINYIENNNLKNNIKIIPHLKNPYPYIKNSDFFVLTSKYEGMPNVLLETAIIKTLIISSNCPTGPKELIQNKKNGFLFKNNSETSLANLLNKIYKKNNKKILSNMYKKIKHEYNNKNNIDNLINLINTI